MRVFWLVLIVLCGGGAATAQESARAVNANWNFYLLDETIAIFPRSMTYVGIDASAYSAADKASISRQTLFHLGRSRDEPAGSRFILLGIPKALCRDHSGLSTMISGPARLRIEVDGRSLASLKLEAQCGRSAMIEEANTGSAMFSAITTAFRRGRNAKAWLIAGKARVFGYQFTLTGFTQAAGALERTR